MEDVYPGFDLFVLPSLPRGLPPFGHGGGGQRPAGDRHRHPGLPPGGRPWTDRTARPPPRPVRLASAIEELALDPALRRRMGTAGRRKAEAEFDDRAVVVEDAGRLRAGACPRQSSTRRRTPSSATTAVVAIQVERFRRLGQAHAQAGVTAAGARWRRRTAPDRRPATDARRLRRPIPPRRGSWTPPAHGVRKTRGSSPGCHLRSGPEPRRPTHAPVRSSMEATSPTTVSTPGWCNRVTLVAGRPTSRTSVPGTAARMRGEMAAAIHCAPSMLGGYPRLPWKSTTGGPPAAGFPAGRCGRGYVLGITVTLGSADLAASSSLGTTTRSTPGGHRPLESTPVDAVETRLVPGHAGPHRAERTGRSELVGQQIGPQPRLDVLEVHQIDDSRSEVGPSRPFVRGRPREPHHVVGRPGPVAQDASRGTVGSGHGHLDRDAPAGRPFHAPSELERRTGVLHAHCTQHGNRRWYRNRRLSLVVDHEQIQVGHRCHGLHDLGQADKPAAEGRPRHVVGHEQRSHDALSAPSATAVSAISATWPSTIPRSNASR